MFLCFHIRLPPFPHNLYIVNQCQIAACFKIEGRANEPVRSIGPWRWCVALSNYAVLGNKLIPAQGSLPYVPPFFTCYGMFFCLILLLNVLGFYILLMSQ